ncbi:hypothetical protein SEPCBS57363_000661 [Sporothrix epigloea]|uniref:Mediator complex subunit 13 n=1 Tax=Sporothrix epigloea TaxID=1892477 RepID=A0ABP0D8T0_9PEZI
MEDENKDENEDEDDSLLNEEDFEPLGETVSAADAEEIWNSLLGAEGEVTQDEVFSYIDEMRPTDEPILPEAVFNKAARDLADSFTVAQLHAYIRKYRKPTAQPTVYPWEVQRRPWMPDAYGDDNTGTAKLKSIGPGSSHLLKGYIQSSMTNKERVVVQLMRECWGVSMWEVMETPGQLEVTVREVEFALLTAGARTWLRDISRAYSTVTTTTAMASRSRSRSHSRSQTRLHRHIELVPGQHKLRVFAPASTADAILAEINAILREATTKRFKLATLLRPDAIAAATAPAMLRAVGTLTDSWVRLSSEDEEEGGSSGHGAPELLVSWVAPADRDPDLEDTGDMVFRMLLRAFGPTRLPATRATTKLDYAPPKNSKAQLFVDMDDYSRDAWSWEHRKGHWARLVEPLSQDSSTFRSRAEETTTIPSESAFPMELTLSDPLKAAHGSEWYKVSCTSTVATFGRVLHAQASRTTDPLISLESSNAATALPDMHRILSPTTPPLLGMALLPDGSTDVSTATSATAPPAAPSTSTTIVLRFLPDPKSPLAHRAPLLEVLLDAEQGLPPTLAGLHAITGTNTCDVLFPFKAVDARITQKQFYALSGADIATMVDAESASPDASSGMAPLFQFLKQSQLQLMTGQQGSDILATPIRLPKLGLPRGVLLPVEPETSEEKLDAVVTIGYVFAGLEVRRRVATAFEGWQAVLTSVEAGRGDGQWTELSLEAVPANKGLPNDGAQFNGSKASFLQAIGHMVHGNHVQWMMPSEVADPTKRV